MILAELSVERFHRAVWNRVPRLADSTLNSPSASPIQYAVDETSIKINNEWSWVNGAIDIDTKIILDVALHDGHRTDSAAAFLHRLTEKHDILEALFLVDLLGYRTALARLRLSGRIDYADRNLMEKGFQTLKM